jgi:hypothetical protein
MIFQYSISVPRFLDPDGIVDGFPPWVVTERGWSNPSSYYEAESTRNALRRVCRSWDNYLQRYARRFVRMVDVAHGKVPFHYLQSAIRISFNGHNDNWCKVCKSKGIYSSSQGGRPNRGGYFQLCRAIIEENQPFRAQIIDCKYDNSRILDGLLSSFPHLVCIHAPHVLSVNPIFTATELIQSIGSLSFLRHVYTDLRWVGNNLLSIKSSTLTTLSLSFSVPNPSFTSFSDKRLFLPAPRHLHVRSCLYNEPVRYEEPSWLPLVRILGRELRSLFLPREVGCTTKVVPGEIWKICPKLEEFTVMDRPPLVPPPAEHPIHTLGVDHALIAPLHSLKDVVPNWPSLRVIRIAASWYTWRRFTWGWLTNSQMKWIGSRIRLEDWNGESYTEYISRFKSEESE